MSVPVDPDMVRQFLEIISAHALKVTNGNGSAGVLQLCRLGPLDDRILPSRFAIDDVDHMIQAAVCDAEHCNVYIEARTVRTGLKAGSRGRLEDTAHVFALVVDSDGDKGKTGNVAVRPSLMVETSPGNYHLWFLLTRAIPAKQAKLIGDSIRAKSGADQDTGVPTQCYRVAGTPNYPNATKRARGRCTVEPTRIVEWTARLWDPDELLAAFPASASSTSTSSHGHPIDADEASLPANLLDKIRNGGNGRGNDASRSALFHKVVGDLKRRHWTVEAITRLLEKYGSGIGAKYAGRLAREVERSYNKIVAVSSSPPSPPPPPPPPGVTAGSAIPGATPSSAPHVLPTIRLIGGQLPRAVAETEAALRAAGTEVFSRAGSLVYPVAETVTAADGRKTMMAKLSAFTANSFTEPVAEWAIFQRYSIRRKVWVDTDPPLQIVNMVLARESRWTFPRVSGIITTPTLRADGSLLALPGYDSRTELYLMPGLTLPPIPERPSRKGAEKALATLKELFSEFSFKQKALDRSVALAGLLTALLRGSLPTSPICLVQGDGPGVGKSMLVDVIATVATGQLCPVITASRNAEETEKRIGAVLLSGSPIVSLDNIVHDLGGELLCQVTERPIVRIRILGRSEMPDCECHTAVFATGNGVSFQGDMIRRGLLCNLEALSERPELREFSHDALQLAVDNRGAYVAAALTVVRAYLVAGAPRQCGPLGSYTAWSKMVRSPLIWLGEPDPVLSMDEVRKEDPELAKIGEFFQLWQDYGLGLDTPHTTARIIELACIATPNSYNPPWFKDFLLRIAARKGSQSDVSPERLGWWLRRISGRIVGNHRLVKGQARQHITDFKLVNT